MKYLIIISLIIASGCMQADKGEVEVNSAAKQLAFLNELPTVISAKHSEIVLADLSYPSTRIETRHYIIETTVKDKLLLRRLPMLLESAWNNYNSFMNSPEQVTTEKGLVYYFNDREQWSKYTYYFSGESAATLDKISSGAYCLNNVCVAWQIDRQADFSVLAHEAWHQYCGMNMKYNLPSWLAESSAVYLEAYKWDAKGLDFSPKYNINRVGALKLSIVSGINFSIEQLVSTDPGYILEKISLSSNIDPDMVIAGYYARLYALGRFMFEYEYGVYRKNYEQIFIDTLTGDLKLADHLKAVSADQQKLRIWNKLAGRELFVSYLGQPEDFEGLYQQYCQKLAGTVRIKNH